MNLPWKQKRAPSLSRLIISHSPTKKISLMTLISSACCLASYSTEGPAMARTDLNKDGLDDMFVGGAKGQASMLYVQNKNKSFDEKQQKAFDILSDSEVVDAIFFDMDKDGDDDLYVVTGGYEFEAADKALYDFLFENKGNGDFVLKDMPAIASSGSCVRPSDIDLDGDLDLFVGSRIVPGRYPETPESYILVNDGKGNFLMDESASKPIRRIGMVTDARWVDLNKDGYTDLVIVGEWMPVKVFINKKGQLEDRSADYVPAYTEGFWNCIQPSDFDGDGDVDFIAGNVGSNNQMKPTNDKPVSLYFADYDNNGSIDPIIDYYIKDASYPYPSRDELIEQLPSFRKRFTDYKSYSIAKIDDLLSADELKKSQVLKAYLLKSCFIRNDSGKFSLIPLPNEFQVAPIFSILNIDIDLDGRLDIITAGNLSGTRSRTGKLSGNYGVVGLNDGKGQFKALKQTDSGLSLTGDVRQILPLNEFLVFGINNQKVLVYQKNKPLQHLATN